MRGLSLVLLLLSQYFLFGQLPNGFVQERLVDGLDPTRIVEASDGRLFIAQKNGTVLIFRDGALLPDPFLQIEVDNFNERGLAGFAIDPDFDRNNQLYVFYTVPGLSFNRVSRFTANGDLVIPGSEEVLLDLDPMPGTIHNGGALVFDGEGKLFISTGDGNSGQDAQRLTSTHGKILRILPDGAIPQDNPFFQEAEGKYRAIWAMGFRNPFTIDFDDYSGKLFANDVGSEFFEEVNEVVPGGNYGWPLVEGFQKEEDLPGNYQDPIHAYSHSVGCSITGAAFYDPELATFPELYHGSFFFADYCEGSIRLLNPSDSSVVETFIRDVQRPVGLLTAQNGDFYYLARAGLGGGSMEDNTSSNNGSLWRVSYTGSGAPFIAVQPAGIRVPQGESALFGLLAIGAEPLTFQWFRNGAPIPEAVNDTLVLPSTSLADDGALFFCRIENNEGELYSDTVSLNVTTNTRPSLSIELEMPHPLYHAGDTLRFTGFAEDAEDGILSKEQLQWRIDFHHDDHTHPALDPVSGISAGSYIIPVIGELSDNVWYRIYLTATDSEGLTRTVYEEVYPQKTSFTVLTDPPGFLMNVDGRVVSTPHTTTSVVGIRRTLGALSPQSPDSLSVYEFEQWSGFGEGPLFTFAAGDVDSLRAEYREIPFFEGMGSGLMGRYHQGGRDLAFQNPPLVERVDSQVDFNWLADSPDPKLFADNFAVRWSGSLLAPFSGKYTFLTRTDDGTRLWVDGQLLVDQWVNQSSTTVSGTIDLEAGEFYAIRMEYFEAGGDANAQLSWSHQYIPPEVIPTSYLYPEDLSQNYLVDENTPFIAYPNPVDNFLTLEVFSEQNGEALLQIFDNAGRAIGRFPFELEVGGNRIEVSLSGLPSGTYTLRWEGLSGLEDGLQILKF